MKTDNIAYTDKYIEKFNESCFIFDSKYFIKGERKELSEKYYIITKIYNNNSDGGYKHASITDIFERSGKLIYDFKNIDNEGEFCTLISHKNGNEYVLFRRDLYGHSVLNLSTMEDYHYFPRESFEGQETFIWTDVHYNKLNNILAVGGCIWAHMYDIMLMNLENPMIYNAKQVSAYEKLNADADETKYGDFDFFAWEKESLVLECEDMATEERTKITIEEKEYLMWIK
jgi:hypothetical protein